MPNNRPRKSTDMSVVDWETLDRIAQEAGASGWRNLLLLIARGAIPIGDARIAQQQQEAAQTRSDLLRLRALLAHID